MIFDFNFSVNSGPVFVFEGQNFIFNCSLKIISMFILSRYDFEGQDTSLDWRRLLSHP